MNYDIIIIGAGISGATLAERFANIQKKKVLVIENRKHIGGNCHDFFNKQGILVPRYGPHFFHTNYHDVWEYVNRFTKWLKYEHRVLSNIDAKKQLVSVPININTINTLLDLNIKNGDEMRKWFKMNTLKIKNPKNSEELALATMGKELYEKIFKNYTKKQWDLWPHELNSSVLARIPIRYNFDDRYFSDEYQAMPKHGYTKMFENMLDNPRIKLLLNTDFYKIKNKIKNYDKIFYSGPIDSFFEYKYGKLQYRSLKFSHKILNTEYYQPIAQINFPNNYKFTRITEPKHATGQKHKKTAIIKEYSKNSGEPYYPVPTDSNYKILNLYNREAHKAMRRNIYFIGRLAEYKYFNMDQAFKNALDVFNYFNIDNYGK